MLTLKKSLGQHFLKDENVCRNIVEALEKEPFSQLLEVGPGAGALTKYLMQLKNISFKAVELDKEKVDYLLQQYPLLNGQLIHNNFLDIDPPFVNEFIVVGNFPYNISTEILFKILDWKEKVPIAIGMFQKEVAKRIAAQAGNKIYGVTSVLVQAFYDVEYLFDVSESSFNPPPKVMSGVIKLRRKNTPVSMVNEKKFRTLVKTAFNQRRKTLRNAVKPLFAPGVMEDEVFNKRAEALTVEQFGELSFKML